MTLKNDLADLLQGTEDQNMNAPVFAILSLFSNGSPFDLVLVFGLFSNGSNSHSVMLPKSMVRNTTDRRCQRQSK